MIKNLDRFSDIPNGKSLTERQKGLAHGAKKNFSKSSYAHIESSIHNPAKKFSTKVWKFLLISGKYKNTYNFLEKPNSLQMFPVDT